MLVIWCLKETCTMQRCDQYTKLITYLDSCKKNPQKTWCVCNIKITESRPHQGNNQPIKP